MLNKPFPGSAFRISNKSPFVLIAADGKLLLEWKGWGLRR